MYVSPNEFKKKQYHNPHVPEPSPAPKVKTKPTFDWPNSIRLEPNGQTYINGTLIPDFHHKNSEYQLESLLEEITNYRRNPEVTFRWSLKQCSSVTDNAKLFGHFGL